MTQAILGISAYYHDSAAAILFGDDIVAAAQEERFSRKKHDSSFPSNAVSYVLQEAGLSVDDLTAIAYYDKPFLKFERLLETTHSFVPKGLKQFLSSMPVWMKEKLFMRQNIWKNLEKLNGNQIDRKLPILFPEHHLSHAASCFYPSPFEEAAILTVDGVGEWTTSTIGYGKGKDISTLRELPFPHSLGLMYSAFTSYCGFKVNSGEYKLMGLAPYGNRESEQCRQYKKKIFEQIIDVRKDGSFLLNMDYFDYVTGLQMCNYKKWENLFGLKRRLPESDLTQPYMDMALACQQATEEIVLSLCRTAQELTGTKNLVMAGGVALNCVANGKIMQEKIFNNIWIQPAAGDAGGALGAAYAARHIWAKKDRKVKCIDSMKGAYLGPAFTNDDVVRLQRQYGACFTQYDSFSKLIDIVSSKLDNGSIVGWFQGRMEWGPRALGNRSILADPRNEKIQKRLNLKIKFREGFRPFAPSVMVEAVNDYFELNEPSPYMLHVASVNKERCNPLPDGYEKREMYERLYFKRSDIPAITHVDYSARIQTVDRQTNEKYWKLINAFKEKTGFGLLVNTSFNVRGEPIVCTPGDAFKCFMMTQMDLLVINDCLFIKQEQPNNDWLHDFELD